MVNCTFVLITVYRLFGMRVPVEVKKYSRKSQTKLTGIIGIGTLKGGYIPDRLKYKGKEFEE
jgi:hypothetical protein